MFDEDMMFLDDIYVLVWIIGDGNMKIGMFNVVLECFEGIEC